jgi:hypothetical protein
MHERIAKLIERLHEKTKAKTIAWEKSPSGNFEASFPNYTVELSQGGSTRLFLTIYNEEGDMLDKISDETLMTEAELFDHGLMLGELYGMARRIALGSDQAIESLISALEN